MSDETPENPSPLEDVLRQVLGEQGAAEAMRALRAEGVDTAELSARLGSPEQIRMAMTQFQHLMNVTEGPVNWPMVSDHAHQRIWLDTDPAVTATEAARAREAMTVADLWLDTVTDFEPGTVTREVWSRTQWVDRTLDMWKHVSEPVASNVSRALQEAFAEQMPPVPEDGASDDPLVQLAGRTTQILPKLSAMMFSAQMGQALVALAKESLGSTDVGLPLAPTGVTALVQRNVESFADGLDMPFTEVAQFLAVRECAHQRLFRSVPWLASDLLHAVETYGRNIALDTGAIAEAARAVNMSDPTSIESALSGDVFSRTPTPEQVRALEHLETLLALIEGWVEVVTARAVAPYLPHADELREMMRRRRVSGDGAERALADLVGLKMRPRRTRGAAHLFTLVEAEEGRTGREALWSHPDIIPTGGDLDEPESFLLLRRAAQEKDADMDAELARLLDEASGEEAPSEG